MPAAHLQVVQLWRKELSKINPKAAESLADPAQYKNLFPNIDLALQAEQLQASLATSSTYPDLEDLWLCLPALKSFRSTVQKHGSSLQNMPCSQEIPLCQGNPSFNQVHLMFVSTTVALAI